MRRLVGPEVWAPILIDAIDLLKPLLGNYGVEPIIANAGAYGVHVEFDATRYVDLVLSRPLNVSVLSKVLARLKEGLTERGYYVVGGRLQLGRTSDDWVIQLFVTVSPGVLLGVEVFNLLAARPASLFEVEEGLLYGRRVKVLTLESWFASKLADPNGVDEANLRRLEKASRAVDIVKLVSIVQRLHVWETIRLNARDALARTKSERLGEILSLFA